MQQSSDLRERALLLDQNQSVPLCPLNVVTLYNFGLIARARPGDVSFKCLVSYQLSMVGYAPTMVVTGDGESGFRFARGSLRNGYHITRKGSRRANYPLPERGGSDEK
ncbi:hypothetical protein JTE90_012046 [Oedothorax gibbosus]|uniref:Uncharacterized protein n=1 Tax=Oedothorax gibbosus TaxID=931172 RepID=A0AAV6TEM9_9ARAC|nr:hypothetical protein JTE90_012046 [Oedothorax gibbosus]